MDVDDPLRLTAEAVAGLPLPAVEQVLAAWVKAGRSELPAALAASAVKAHARLGKKALYQLRSQGVVVEAPPAPTAPVVPLAPAEAELPGALSAILGTGERALVFARPVRGGGLTVYQGVYSDEEGVLQLVTTPSTRGEYRRRLAELRGDREVKVLEVSWERVRQELGQALWLSDRAATPPGAQVMDVLRPLQLTALDPEVPLPPPEEGDARLAARAASLRQERELSTWLPSEPALAELAAALAAVGSAYLTPARRRRYGRRLWAMAELLEASRRPDPAAVARAEARRLFHTGEPSAFVEAMFLAAAEARPPRPPAEPTAPAPPALILP